MDLQRLINWNAVELLENAEILEERPRRIYNRQRDPFELNDDQFIRLFRLNKDLATNIINLFDELHDNPHRRSSALTSETKVLTALRFYASGSYQMDVGYNYQLACSQPSVSRCLRDVNSLLNNPVMFNEWVHFPRSIPELESLRNRFYTDYGFPGVCGCVDCTHIAIVPPSRHDNVYPEHVYVNRKGYHSFNVQLICDSGMKIIHVNAKYPGSSHNSFIWNNSNVLPLFQTLHARGHDQFHLLENLLYMYGINCISVCDSTCTSSVYRGFWLRLTTMAFDTNT
ncbi:putative nuclease HARBI1 isoform X1 [Athalia rosae]|uniref:putative nuclease HARBI1 isoform X1 n=1 Tax=Athalia rosae TaxID=37344 RepID=UPI0020346C2F|nr:putative nuclease HARBI1 isoform X1 [Athalia rosae]